MREHISRIHHHVFMDEESVPESMVLKVGQSRPASKFWNWDTAMWKHISRIHHHVFMDEKSVPEYMVLKVVQSKTVLQPNFKNETLQCEKNGPAPEFSSGGVSFLSFERCSRTNC